MNAPTCWNCRRRPMSISKVLWGQLVLQCPVCEKLVWWPGNLDLTKPDLIKNPEAPLLIMDADGGMMRWHPTRRLWILIRKGGKP